jgi:hypothetical protein
MESLPNDLLHLQHVRIYSCPGFQSIPELSNLQILSVFNCPELRSFTSFGNSDQVPIQSVYFDSCKNLETVIVKRRIILLTLGSKVTVESRHLVRKIASSDFP